MNTREILDHVTRVLVIDPEWSERTPTSITWWAGKHRQRIWLDLERKADELTLRTIRCETDFLRELPDLPRAYAASNKANREASLFAHVIDRGAGTVKLHSALLFHEENLHWLCNILTTAAGLQVSFAEDCAEAAASAFRAVPDTSPHPHSGFRTELDEIATLARQMPALSSLQGGYDEDDFEEAKALTERFSMMTNTSQSGLTAEFIYSDTQPSPLMRMLGRRHTTALFQAETRAPHPDLGDGCLLLLRLPTDIAPERGAELAAILNMNDRKRVLDTPVLGAWCCDDDATLTHVTFVPAILHDGPYSLVNLMLIDAWNTQVARGVLEAASPS